MPELSERMFEVAPPTLDWSLRTCGPEAQARRSAFRGDLDKWAELEFALTLQGLYQRGERERLGVSQYLLLRHSLPYLLADRALGRSVSIDLSTKRSVLRTLLDQHTFSLTRLDQHLDGGVDEDSGYSQSMRTVTVSSLHSLFDALSQVSSCPEALAAVAASLPVTMEVFRGMEADRRRRYNCDQLEVRPASSMPFNLKVDGLRASGYWEVMIRGRLAASDERIPAVVEAFLGQLRVCRQVADEITDFREDLAAGLCTVPLTALLAVDPDRDYWSRQVASSWVGRAQRSVVQQTLQSRVLAHFQSSPARTAATNFMLRQFDQLELAWAELDQRWQTAMSPLVAQRVSKGHEALAA